MWRVRWVNFVQKFIPEDAAQILCVLEIKVHKSTQVDTLAL